MLSIYFKLILFSCIELQELRAPNSGSRSNRAVRIIYSKTVKVKVKIVNCKSKSKHSIATTEIVDPQLL